MHATARPSIELGCVTYYVRLVKLPVHKPSISSCVMQLSCRVRPGYGTPVYVKLLKRQVAPSLPNMHSNFPCVFCAFRLPFRLSILSLFVQLECRITKSYNCTGGLVTLFLKLPFTSYYRFDSHFYETLRHTLYSRRVQRWRKGGWRKRKQQRRNKSLMLLYLHTAAGGVVVCVAKHNTGVDKRQEFQIE